MINFFENILIIANPASQTGKGAVAAEVALRELQQLLPNSHVQLALTAHPKHAEQIANDACTAGSATALIAVGGDGTIHETVNGIMQAHQACPSNNSEGSNVALGIIPVGSGNDYARALGMSTNVYTACKQIASAHPTFVDVGTVNGSFYMETLSFGLDAAIALDTVQRRIKTGHTGTRLYMESGFDQLFNHLDTHSYTAYFDGEGPINSQSITFAVQIGPYYGGGFKVCPSATLSNGMLDVCIAHPPLGKAGAVMLFLRAKNGMHTSNKQIEIRQCKKLVVDFDAQPAAQMDGEEIRDTHFEVEVLPSALTVLHP